MPAFVAKTRAAFGAPVELLDFKQAPERSRVHINQWVEEKTRHRIQNLIPQDAVKPDTRLVLVNAIYFLGDWADPFKRDETRPMPFHLTASETKDVPTMTRTGQFRIAQQDGVTALEIPYKGGELSMMLLVPDAIDGLAAVEGTLDARKIDALASAMKPEWVWVALPKFEVNPGESLSARRGSEGAGDAPRLRSQPGRLHRDRESAQPGPAPGDRGGLPQGFREGRRKGHRSRRRHRGDGVETGASPGGGPRPFQANRPFLFLIRDNASGLVLFLGRVSDPSRR